MNSSSKMVSKVLKGKLITSRKEDCQEDSCLPSEDIIMFDYDLSNNARSACNLGLIKNTNELVAIRKVINSGTDASHLVSFRKQYRRELNNILKASVRSRGEHSNIVRVVPLVCESLNKSHAYLIMEFCKGGTLETEMRVRSIRGTWFTFREFGSLLEQLINGYQQLHRCEILHQNINPSNIFINEGYLKIGGFGSSLNLNEETTHRSMGGNPYYCAPEKYGLEYRPSAISDIFSLGVLIYEIMFNCHPYCPSYSSSDLQSARSTQKNQHEMVRRMVEEAKIAKDRQPCVVQGNQEQRQTLVKILGLVVRMLQKNPGSRIKFEQITLTVRQLLIPKAEPIHFLNVKSIPAKFSYVIETESKVETRMLNFQPLQLKDLQQLSPQLLQIRCESQKINVLSNFLFSLAKRVERQIQVHNIRDQSIIDMMEKLFEFNFCLTYNKYTEMLKTIAGLTSSVKIAFYRTGVDYIVDNTKSNVEFLLSQTTESGQVGRLEDMMELAKTSPKIIFDDMADIVNQNLANSTLDEKNYNYFMIMSVILELLRTIGSNFSIDQARQLALKFDQIEANLGHFQLQEIQEQFKQFGISFGLSQQQNDE